MDSPLTRIILTTIGGYLLILVLLSVYDWVLEEYPCRPSKPDRPERIQHPFHHQGAKEALLLFSRLSKSEKTALQNNLESNLISIDAWLSRLGQSEVQILCMGELHKESTRSFLSQEVFAKLRVDVLLLEATPSELKGLIRRMGAGREYFPLLDADIMNILRSARDMNPDIRIHGIEQTGNQAGSHGGRFNSRDQSIAQNFWAAFQTGSLHIILFGALHCTNESNWLFQTLCRQAPSTLEDKMLNVRVLGEHQNGPVEAFVYFMDQIGSKQRHFVIPDTRSLPACIYKWFPLLNRQTLEKYRSVIIFRT